MRNNHELKTSFMKTDAKAPSNTGNLSNYKGAIDRYEFGIVQVIHYRHINPYRIKFLHPESLTREIAVLDFSTSD